MKMMIKTGAALLLAPLASAAVARVALPPTSPASSAVSAAAGVPEGSALSSLMPGAVPGFEAPPPAASVSADDGLAAGIDEAADRKAEPERRERALFDEARRRIASQRLRSAADAEAEGFLRRLASERGIAPIRGGVSVRDLSRDSVWRDAVRYDKVWVVWTDVKGYQIRLTLFHPGGGQEPVVEIVEVDLGEIAPQQGALR